VDWSPVTVFDDDARDDEVRGIVLDAVGTLHPDRSCAVELRVLPIVGPVRTGLYRDREALAAHADAFDRSGGFKGVYVNLHRSRADRPAIDRVVPGGRGLRNTDIDYRQWVPIDLDPVRPADTSSTDEELRDAIKLANEIALDLIDSGVPAGALLAAQSGNGAHLLVCVSLPADDGGLTRRFLARLDQRYSSATVRVDTGVHNPGRVWRLFGTVARKGDVHDLDRQHRRGRILRSPAPGVEAPVALLAAFASLDPVPVVSLPAFVGERRPNCLFDGHAIARRLGVYRSGSGNSGGTLYVVACPWRDHGPGDRAAWLLVQPNGAIAAGCHHSHCADESWQTLRLRLEAAR